MSGNECLVFKLHISCCIVDGKSEIELSSEHIEISRKFKEEVVQPILKVLQPSEKHLNVHGELSHRGSIIYFYMQTWNQSCMASRPTCSILECCCPYCNFVPMWNFFLRFSNTAFYLYILAMYYSQNSHFLYNLLSFSSCILFCITA